MNFIETDVLIVGGGPSGTAAALSLLKYSKFRVTIIEQSDLNLLRIGEHVSASVFQLLKYVDLSIDDFEAQTFTPNYRSISYWSNAKIENRESIHTPEGPGFQLNRTAFDLALIRIAAARGCEILPRTRCHSFVQLADHSWQVKVKHKTKGEILISSKYLVDATGRQSNISRKLGIEIVKDDNLVSVGLFLRYPKSEVRRQEQFIEASSFGWWYHAILNENLIAVALYSDSDLIKDGKLTQVEKWWRELGTTEYLSKKTKGLQIVGKGLWTRNAFSKMADARIIPRFMNIGDALISFDPISAMGLGFAISSAYQGARVIISELTDDSTELRDLFHQDICRIYQDYLQKRRRIYRTEKNFSSPFWVRRQ